MDHARQRRDDFVVRIGQGPEGLVVQVTESPEGQSPSAPFRNPFSDAELRELERRFADAGEASGPREAGHRRNVRPLDAPDDGGWAERAGERLFGALLPEPIRKHWRKCLWRVDGDEDPRRRLLLRVRFDLAGAGGGAATDGELLHRLPWELLRDPERGRFLAQDDRCSVARYLEVAKPAFRDPPSGPLVVLAAGATPRGDATPLLDLGTELGGLEEALGEAVELRPLANASLEALRRELRRETVHVLHFMGHGDFDRATGEGLLMLEDDAGRPAPVGSRTLLEAIGDALQGTRLVVLNACRTAEAAASAPWAGLATALVARGVGAVVAMGHPITDRAALAFSRGFYGHLADGGEIDAAVHEGRRAILEASPGSAEWAIPALFLRSSDGPLVRAPASSGEDEEPAPSRPPRWRGWIGAVAASSTIVTAALVLWIGLDGGRGGPPAAGRHPDAETETRRAPEAEPGAVHRLPIGEPVALPGFGVVVVAEPVTLHEQEMVRLTVSPDGGESAVRAVFPGGSAEFPLLRSGAAESSSDPSAEAPAEVLSIHVLSLDRAARIVAVRAFRTAAAEG